MRLATRIRPFSDTNVIEGTVTDEMRDEWHAQIRQARLDTARRQSWTEIPETRLVHRGRFLVDAETDLVYVHRPGHVFEQDRASVGYVPDNAAMVYTVDEAGSVVFLERVTSPSTWSEVVARRARRT